ncbi:MAG: hypothetical protein ACXV8J_12115, partial [Methylobacter sp.]
MFHKYVKCPSVKLLMLPIITMLLGAPVVGSAQIIRVYPDSYQVVPTQNSPGKGSFKATVDRTTQTITYELAWHNLKGNIL